MTRVARIRARSGKLPKPKVPGFSRCSGSAICPASSIRRGASCTERRPSSDRAARTRAAVLGTIEMCRTNASFAGHRSILIRLFERRCAAIAAELVIQTKPHHVHLLVVVGMENDSIAGAKQRTAEAEGFVVAVEVHEVVLNLG